MKRSNGSLPFLIGSVLAVATLVTLLVKGGWLIWLPVTVALLIVYYLGRMPSR